MSGGRKRRVAVAVVGGLGAAVWAGPNGAPALAATRFAAAPAVTRYAGTDRFQTAADLSADNFDPPAPVVYVARGDAFADALAGTPAASFQGGPVLLVANAAVPPTTAAELSRLQPNKII